MGVQIAEIPAVMTIKQTADLLQISRGLCYELARRGELPVLRAGRRILVPWAALERMLAGAGRQSPELKSEAPRLAER